MRGWHTKRLQVTFYSPHAGPPGPHGTQGVEGPIGVRGNQGLPGMGAPCTHTYIIITINVLKWYIWSIFQSTEHTLDIEYNRVCDAIIHFGMLTI